MNQYSIAIAGATGLVGRTILAILAQRGFPASQIYPLASERSVGKKLKYAEGELIVGNLETFDFSQAQIGLFSAGASISETYAPRAAECGCWVVDNTSHFRYMDNIPLVVSEVNPEHLERAKDRIIANPNCSTMQMMVALNPIQKAVGISRINVTTYQSVSGSGNKGVEDLAQQVNKLHIQKKARLDKQDCHFYPRQIAYNILPHIDEFLDNGYTKEEMKMVWETNKIFDDKSIQVNPTCVRVPVKTGHSLAVHLETREPLSVKQAIELMQAQPNLVVHQKAEDYPTPLEHADGTDDVHVGRIRQDISHPNGLNMWIVGDNLRKGAALNTVQIAELLIDKGMVTSEALAKTV